MTATHLPAWHEKTVEEVAEQLETDLAAGLAREEARVRLEQYGPNEVVARRGRSALLRFLLHFHQPLIYVLLVAGVVTVLLSEYIDAVVIFAVVLLNAVMGYLQEARALTALASLSKTLAQHSTVVRDGKRHVIPAREVVPGDLVVVEAGDKVPADLRLVRSRELQTVEAALTGESVPVPKSHDRLPADVEFGGRNNMAYSSTLAASGFGIGLVVATGEETEVGRISRMIESADDLATPLTRRITWFSKALTAAILGLATTTFLIGLAHGDEAGEVFLASVALAVAAIPEGLPAVITITLAIGVSRMAGRRAIIRKLPAVETLGSTTVICSDKTGTLTQSQMTVQQIWAGGHDYEVTGIGYAPEGEIRPLGDSPSKNEALDRCLLAGVLCNEASLVEEEGSWTIHGDPTEGALIVAGEKAGRRLDEFDDRFPRLDTIPFESQRQYMATLHRQPDGDTHTILLKGAVETILPRCANYLDPEGRSRDLDADQVMMAVQAMAANGLRVLTFAEKKLPTSKTEIFHEDAEEGLIFLGMQAMIDPPREEVIDAIRECRTAGIMTKMITGDHAITASAIAHQIGIGAPHDKPTSELPVAVTGRELENMDDDEIYRVAQDVHVFARVPPASKLRLVQALQKRGHIVAMTGDGVNDGPALRQADIGIAMGITGTEVAREAGDMVLTDDNFASIVAAVEEGRGVFDNLTKFLLYILPTNLGQGGVILLAILIGSTLPMLPVQVLWVNMATAIFLGLVLAFEPKEAGIMLRQPRDPKAQLITGDMAQRMLLVSLIMVAGAFGLYELSLSRGASLEEARTVAVNVVIMVQIFYLLNCRSMTRSVFAIGLTSNPWAMGGIAIMILLQIAFTYLGPMNSLFNTEAVSADMWPAIIAVGALTFVAVELEKRLRTPHGAAREVR